MLRDSATFLWLDFSWTEASEIARLKTLGLLGLCMKHTGQSDTANQHLRTVYDSQILQNNEFERFRRLLREVTLKRLLL